MQIIKFNTIESTNDYVKFLLKNQNIDEDFCVWALNQTKGRGQVNGNWIVEPFKNLTFSLCFKGRSDFGSNVFAISMLVAVTIQETLSNLGLLGVSVKWPNDILAYNKKVGGLLIETTYTEGKLKNIIMGVGLNINQECFDGLPKAGSLKSVYHRHFDLDDLFKKLIDNLENAFYDYTTVNFNHLKQGYEGKLFRNGKPSTFQIEDQFLVGIIQGVTDYGKLIVLHEDDQVQYYDMKEVSLLYNN